MEQEPEKLKAVPKTEQGRPEELEIFLEELANRELRAAIEGGGSRHGRAFCE